MASQKITFKKDQFVVYPMQGVGKILDIEEQVIGGEKMQLLVIELERDKITLRVPTMRTEVLGLRPLVSGKAMGEAIESAKMPPASKRMIWARRALQYEEKINSGNPMELADVIRDLQRRNAEDPMTFSGRKLYLKALGRMAEEFAVLHKIKLEEAEEKIEDLLGVPKEIDLNAVKDE
ncbi:MAG: CarD family transcriptional regulator [Rickettsiales bacterium]|jgi:CarD family transcriptional regulator|nr:CarD family transcriptional regulator [Rickettsiales bacterium]